MSAQSRKLALKAARLAERSNLDAAELCAARGDIITENAFRRAAARARYKVQRLEGERTHAGELALKAVRDRRSRSISNRKRDTLEQLALQEPPVISKEQLRAGIILREHVEGHNVSAMQIVERVDGGNLHNGQMEALMDKRRPCSWALAAASEAIQDEQARLGAMHVIVHGISLREACRKSGISEGKGVSRIKNAVVEALDAAVAHLGVAA